MTNWSDIDKELSLWEQPATLWWRDDDASFFCHELELLLTLSARHAVPLHLAVIPEKLDSTVAELLRNEDKTRIRVLQHGFEHANHAREGQKKIELGGTQPLPALIKQLKQGRNALMQQFGQQYLDILVPPWNRLEARVEAALPDIGYQQLSVLGPRNSDALLPQTNVHIDIFDWKKRQLKEESDILTALLTHLQQRRFQQVDNQEPTGLMTHHQVHDKDCWLFLEQFFTRLSSHTATCWVTGQALTQRSKH
uniref:Polysaccharide deacetylase n=1 Tax=uncultured Thiotrichaceae bacterium TaxID=298394 RepID=A0A6S6UKI5_9GAMM|nr:MAG: Unknown protein [uncultured Thiotrichaceae bacterium]